MNKEAIKITEETIEFFKEYPFMHFACNHIAKLYNIKHPEMVNIAHSESQQINITRKNIFNDSNLFAQYQIILKDIRDNAIKEYGEGDFLDFLRNKAEEEDEYIYHKEPDSTLLELMWDFEGLDIFEDLDLDISPNTLRLQSLHELLNYFNHQ